MARKHELFDMVAQTGQALASGKRLELLELLAQHPRGVGALADIAGLNVTTVSAHLQVLKEAGLVTSRRDGTSITYALAGDDVASLLITLLDVAERHSATVRDARSQLLPTAPLVSIDEYAHLDSIGAVLVLDVRPADEYAHDHLPEAVNIPVSELKDRVDELPGDVSIVVYCRGRYCPLSHDALGILTAHGRTARILPAGVAEWRALSVRTAS